MKIFKLTVVCMVLSSLVYGFQTQAQSGYNKQHFYDAMSATNLSQIDQALKEAQQATGTDKQAIIGTLTMKKAGLVSGPGKKLKTFKAGHKELEAAISHDQDNAEYRFMRLMIQENAPGILGYKSEIEKDSEYIRKSFKSLPETLQKAILHYSKSSKILSEKDLTKIT
jgi:hypothetical protein